jgi:hypothetical protein
MAPSTLAPAPPSVKVTKSFTHNGTTYNVGAIFTGSQDEIDLLVQQGFADPPKTPAAQAAPPAPPPAPESVTVTKDFTHDGHEYHAGDTFTGSAYDCQLLIAQGFAAQPAAKWGGTPPQAAPAPTGTSSIY